MIDNIVKSIISPLKRCRYRSERRCANRLKCVSIMTVLWPRDYSFGNCKLGLIKNPRDVPSIDGTH